MDKLVLIDGHSILHRAFYGVPDLTNSEGLHTNAIYGFLNIMFHILDEEKPDYFIVTFDEHAPTFRHEMFDAYKGTRKPMPEELRSQVPLMKEMLSAMGVLVISKPGFEADDLMGTLAREGERMGLEVAIISGDRDLLQIASEHIMIRIPKTKKGGTEIENYKAADVKEKYQLTPAQFIELKALMGDTADNIPGVPKVGEKTATELMLQYGSIDAIYEHIEEIKKNSIRESLRENRELADLSLKLATIKTDCELDVHPDDAPVPDFYTKEAYELCRKLELKSFYKRFDDAVTGAGKEGSKAEIISLGESGLEELLEKAAASGTELAVILRDLTAEEYTVSFSNEAGKAYCTDNTKVPYEKLRGVLRKYYSAGMKVVTCDIKVLYPLLCAAEDYKGKSAEDMSSGADDVMLMAYLLDPTKGSYKTEDMAGIYLSEDRKSFDELFIKKGTITVSADDDALRDYMGQVACDIRALYAELKNRLESTGMFNLYRDMEMPLSFVLFRMETEGIAASAEALAEYSAELDKSIKELEKKIYDAAGEEFNINSPKQLGVILFEKMGIPGAKKTKTGYSTAADVLEKLAAEYPFVNDILEYRTYAKLKSTYADGLAGYIAGDGRIHTSFNQTVTATGRLSSTEPNLQNIPMRYELGRRIRRVFLPREGYIFADADYSQIELRILASMSGDAELIAAYRSEEDIHRITASKVFHVPFDEVTDLQRRNAKAVNFGIVYGISSFGLSQDLSISREEAKTYIEEYFATYPGVKAFLDSAKENAKKDGYSVTMYGRRRPIPELKSSNFMQRQFGERVAMNAPVQGTAADIIKIAMIKVYNRLEREGLKSKLLLQIHDELLVETALEEKDAVLDILREEMQGAADLPVMLTVEAHTGKDWYEAK